MTDTLAAPASLQTEVRHSRFLAQAAPVDTPDTALSFVAGVSDPAATHNCWAYRIGQDYRSSDDGEPAGTAGRPILAAIDGQGYDRVAVVVTRWFGGIKLGAGGLVRAYGGAAAECLRLATRRPLVPMVELALSCAFEDLGAVHAALPAHAAEKTGESFHADGARLSLRLPAAQAEALQARLRDGTRDRVRFHPPVSGGTH
ncbi:IMPACT family protein [Pseudoxanthomonas broegbernensis]|uniref:IMPACT family protein n=1 Tax=Pseudoxanthomonas broegbernensis TaxID=83619 RepID=A0A7V8GQ70_9GAMM|nr:YigZ family protein [Pseudoxanthomonas broegbernensis]KAF1687991.1 IMPACT family protein [Pseudoxanthomonas broegbernensis]MBB6065007.1 putative YigZ family protein [Pseudoxanthomonas broegbernensis]